MKPVFLLGVAIAAVVGVAAIAFAASGGGDGSDAAQVESPLPDETPMPVEPDGGIGNTSGEDTPLPVEPGGGIGDTPGEDTPLPVEPDGGIGDTPGGETPLPVEPDGGIGDTPLPVEPDGGLGNGPDQPVSDQPIPSEPPFTVTPAPAQPTLPAGRYAEFAPIDQLDLRIAESFPPQYFVYIMAGLPSGCAEQYTHSVARNGNVIQIEVLNSFPEGNPACTAIYGMYELNIPLGSDFLSGQTYTISVNNGAAETTFVAQ